MSTIRVAGVRLRVHPQDHGPIHVHAHYGQTIAVVELRRDGTVTLADRPDRLLPQNAKHNEVRRILQVAAEQYEAIVVLWERMHREN